MNMNNAAQRMNIHTYNTAEKTIYRYQQLNQAYHH